MCLFYRRASCVQVLCTMRAFAFELCMSLVGWLHALQADQRPPQRSLHLMWSFKFICCRGAPLTGT
jgi:hypothetical protein